MIPIELDWIKPLIQNIRVELNPSGMQLKVHWFPRLIYDIIQNHGIQKKIICLIEMSQVGLQHDYRSRIWIQYSILKLN